MVSKPKYKFRSNYPTLLFLFFVTCFFFVFGSVMNTFAQENDNQTTPKALSGPNLLLLSKLPFKTVNPAPADEAVDQSINTTISWENGGLAASYDVYFGTNPAPSDPVSSQTTTTYDPSTLQYDTTYYWRIDSKNYMGTTTGDVWQFTTESAPAGVPLPATNPTPADEASNQPIDTDVSWSDGGGATSYNIYFGTSTIPTNLLRNQTTTSFDPSTLLENTTYYWRIDSINANGIIAGEVWHFTTGTE